jgi:hypothetical protein
MGYKALRAALLAALAGLACAHAPRVAPAPPAAFRHPGVLVTRAQLDFVRAQVRAEREPWASAFRKARDSRWASLDWTPRPRKVVGCGAYSKPNHGCTDERDDAVAAYTHALLFALTDDTRHARKAVQILNAWSAVVKDHTLHNAPLQSAWAASIWPRAAELVRHSDAGWAPAEVARFAATLKKVYLPEFARGSANTNGNWELSMIEAIVAIAVFTDDRRLFDRGVSMWRARVPAYFYMKTDGERAVPAPGGHDDTPEKVVKRWHEQTALVDGLSQETCRDFGHTQYGLSAALNAAETALHQGVDLYAAESARLTAALEFHAEYLLGKSVPDWLCGGTVDLRQPLPTWEVGYNHYARRAGGSLPAAERLVRERVRAHPIGVNHHIVWETLTHGEIGWAVTR